MQRVSIVYSAASFPTTLNTIIFIYVFIPFYRLTGVLSFGYVFKSYSTTTAYTLHHSTISLVPYFYNFSSFSNKHQHNIVSLSASHMKESIESALTGKLTFLSGNQSCACFLLYRFFLKTFFHRKCEWKKIDSAKVIR